jgi:hypothetical protein
MAMTGALAAAVARPDAAASPATSRAGWMDNLRVAVIAGPIGPRRLPGLTTSLAL